MTFPKENHLYLLNNKFFQHLMYPEYVIFAEKYVSLRLKHWNEKENVSAPRRKGCIDRVERVGLHEYRTTHRRRIQFGQLNRH